MSKDDMAKDPIRGRNTGPSIEGIGVNPLDRRRVDVAVDVTPCLVPITVKLAIVGPRGDELSSAVVVQNRDCALDKVMHLRQEAEAGEYTLHVGLFEQDRLVHHATRVFTYPSANPEAGR